MGETFVLVHGGWHDGSAWNSVARCLEAQGHRVYTPTAGGHGPGADRSVTHAQAVAPIVAEIVDHDLRNIILVGHSLGGSLIAKAVEQVPDRVKRLVFFSAFVLADGESVMDTASPEQRQVFEAIHAQSPDGSLMIPYPLWRECLMNDADNALAQQIYEESLSPQPYGPLIERLDLKQFYSLQIPRSYLVAAEDTALPQGERWWHPYMSSRLGLFRFLQMPGGHEVMFTNPFLLAEKLIEAGRD